MGENRRSEKAREQREGAEMFHARRPSRARGPFGKGEILTEEPIKRHRLPSCQGQIAKTHGNRRRSARGCQGEVLPAWSRTVRPPPVRRLRSCGRITPIIRRPPRREESRWATSTRSIAPWH